MYIRNTRFCRYANRSSFFVSKREIPSSGGERAAESGKEADAVDKDSVSAASKLDRSFACAIMVMGWS